MRSIRIPLGFLWLLGVCVLILAVVAYAFGYGRGRSAGFAEGVSQKLEEQAAQASVRTVRDPLRQPAPVSVAAEPAPEPVSAERPSELLEILVRDTLRQHLDALIPVIAREITQRLR